MDSAPIQSGQNSRLKLVRAIRRGRERDALLLEGARLLDEALDASAELRFVLHTAAPSAVGQRVLQRARDAGAEVLECDANLLKEGSDLDAPSDVLAVAERPQHQLEECLLAARRQAGLVLVAAGVQDPGNLGALVRVAAGLGAQSLVALAGSASLWHPRALRGASGTHFRLPLVERVPVDEFLKQCSLSGLPLWAADGSGENVRALRLPAIGCALLLGEEGRGISAELQQASQRTVAIPLTRRVESLNVATAAAVLCSTLIPGSEA